MPVERWAENVSRYYNSQPAPGVGSPCEELSELDSLYQASLQAASLPRATRGISPQPGANKQPARKLLSDLASPGRSKTPTAEIERHAYRTPGYTSSPIQHPKVPGQPSPHRPQPEWHRHRGTTRTPCALPQLRVHQKGDEFLAVFDRGEAFSRDSYNSVALSYGTLPRAPRRAPPSGSSSLPRPREAPGPSLGSGYYSHPDASYATLSRPRRSATPSGATNGYKQPSPSGRAPATCLPPQRHPAHQRLPIETSTQPLRLDVPPDVDWRTPDYRMVPPPAPMRDARPLHQPTHRQDHPHMRASSRGPATAHLCSLCQQLPTEPSRHYCQSCGAYMARFRPAS
ncbi:extensin-like [Esox lucius]|uniref:extensin-like n=1 Tax=Esox lucius TaxID=8010 RepID=UPI0014777F21|nr:extensin-like [Esox lucius]